MVGMRVGAFGRGRKRRKRVERRGLREYCGEERSDEWKVVSYVLGDMLLSLSDRRHLAFAVASPHLSRFFVSWLRRLSFFWRQAILVLEASVTVRTASNLFWSLERNARAGASFALAAAISE